nr:restriction endonuclease subunit S [Rhodovulum strictum]
MQRARQDWPVFRLKHLAKLQGGGTPSKDREAYWTNGDIPWVSPKDMKRRVIADTEDYITEEAVRESATSFVKAGSPLIVARSGILRHSLPVAISGTRVTLNQDMKAFHVGRRLLPEFLVYWIEGQQKDLLLEWRQFGATVESIDVQKMMDGRIALPDLATQKRIAAFLDRETARIDELISKKERLITLLDVKLRNAISIAVTKGINGTVDLKTSGVDWIGEIPAHWTVMKLGYLGRCANGINIGGNAFGSGFPFISYSDVYKNRALPVTVSGLVLSTENDRRAYSVEAGDVFFTRTSETIEEIGFSSVCFETIENAVFAGFLIRFRPRKGQFAPVFSKYAFQHSGLRSYFAKEMNLITRASLSQNLLRNMPVALPPLREQESIGHSLNALECKVQAIAEKTRLTVQKLREYRATLITAAVTGQIDVEAYGKVGTAPATLSRTEEEMQA